MQTKPSLPRHKIYKERPFVLYNYKHLMRSPYYFDYGRDNSNKPLESIQSQSNLFFKHYICTLSVDQLMFKCQPSSPYVQYILTMENKYLIGIRREDKSVWERRAPLTPTHLKEILQTHPHLTFVVQPSMKRIFSDYEYEQAGAILDEDLTKCQLILGIKEIPVEKLIPDKTFLYFSHTIKAQLHNMPALDTILKSNIRLIDYEKITDHDNNRLIAFGKYAGMAGAIDFLKGLGEYIMQMGISTPLLHCNCSYKYFDVEDCYAHLKKIGEKIRQKEIPKELSPMIFAVTGRGRTAQGCMEVLENLPITVIKQAQFNQIIATKDDPIHRKTIYVISVNTEDCIVPRDPEAKFDKNDYYKNPSKYRCNFKQKFLPYISALFHCIFWQPSFPRYIKNKHLYQLANTDNLRLLGICDVTCDLEGSIECLTEYTQPEKPFFYYDSLEDKSTFDANYAPGKVLYLAIDFLPCELAYDASCHFSRLLKDWVENLATSDKSKPLKQQGLLHELERAVIACNGKLTPNFEYINKLREENQKKSLASRKKEHVGMEFDKTSSVFQNNVTVIENIQGEALDFTK